MKIGKMPTTIILLIFSWLIVILGLFGGGFLIIVKSNRVNLLIIGFLILLGSFLLGAIIRMLGNIGQILFDVKSFLFNSNQDLKTQLQAQADTLTQNLQELNSSLLNSHQDLKTQLQAQADTLTQNLQELSSSLLNSNQDLKTQLQAQADTLTQNLQELSSSFEQMGCDSKDINQSINQIKTFFEQIERHLDLKK